MAVPTFFPAFLRIGMALMAWVDILAFIWERWLGPLGWVECGVCKIPEKYRSELGVESGYGNSCGNGDKELPWRDN